MKFILNYIRKEEWSPYGRFARTDRATNQKVFHRLPDWNIPHGPIHHLFVEKYGARTGLNRFGCLHIRGVRRSEVFSERRLRLLIIVVTDFCEVVKE